MNRNTVFILKGDAFVQIKHIKNRITDSGIPEEDFFALGNILAQIGALCRQAENDKCLFQQIEITFHGLTRHLQLLSQFVYRPDFEITSVNSGTTTLSPPQVPAYGIP